MNQFLQLEHGDIVAVIRGAGSSVEVTGGQVWITELGDLNDYIVRDGMQKIRSDASVLIHALEDCRVALTVPAVAQVRMRRRGQAVAVMQLPAGRPLAAFRSRFAFG
jgi:hypothetical protein